MLTVYYLAATWIQSWRLNSIIQKLRAASEKHGSLVVHQELTPFLYSIDTSLKQKLEVNGILSDNCMNYKSGHIVELFTCRANKRAVSVFPKQILDVSGWISVLKRRTHLPIQFNVLDREPYPKDDVIYILVEANYLSCTFDYRGTAIELDKYGIPLAWHASDRLSILLETNETSLAQLLSTFIQNELTLENGIQIVRMLTVEPLGSPYKIGNDATVPETYARLNTSLSEPELRNSFLDRWRAHVSMLCTFCEAVAQVKEAQQDISVRHPGSGVGAVKLVPSGEVIGIGPEVLDLSRTSASCDESLATVYESTHAPSTEEVPTRCSSGQSSQVSTEMSTAQGSTRQVADSNATSMSSIRSLPGTPRRTVSTPVNSSSKPPNIIILSDSPSASDSVKTALESTLITDRYVIHKLAYGEMASSAWLEDAVLVVIHGNVPASFVPVIVTYLAKGGGFLLCLCSDFLGNILPMFHTAEVRPNELVHCSYKTWKHVLLMHHVFCYQPTPHDPKFSYDEQASLRVIPESVEVSDSNSKSHKLKIEVLGVEETWQTPSFLLVTFTDVASKIVFSQVHLELSPENYDNSENKQDVLRNSDQARLGILSDVLSNHLELKCAPKKTSSSLYTLGYFLGNHEAKQELLDRLTEEKKLENNILTGSNLKFKFCGKGVSPPVPSELMLPILIHACPESFSTVEYFENLKTEKLGRLVIFTEVITSCLKAIEDLHLTHGLAVIPYYQTKGIGRSGNTWLSPKGSAMFTIQLHIPLKSYLGQHLAILQFVATLAMVSGVCDLPELEELDLGIKWPNDIYVNKSTKIGGISTKSVIRGDLAIVNLGCGLNLNNKEPTVCLNDVIGILSKEKNVKIPRLSFEKYFSSVFNKLEVLIGLFENQRVNEFYQQYYQYWLHSGADVKITSEDNKTQTARIKGIDDYGFLMVETTQGESFTVQPDGNSFDMLTGLITHKLTTS